jgi:hypothetical protein
MTFPQTLEKHPRAIQQRDLPAPAEAVPDELVPVVADGRLVRSTADSPALHRHWVVMDDCRLPAASVHVFDSAPLGTPAAAS